MFDTYKNIPHINLSTHKYEMIPSFRFGVIIEIDETVAMEERHHNITDTQSAKMGDKQDGGSLPPPPLFIILMYRFPAHKPHRTDLWSVCFLLHPL